MSSLPDRRSFMSVVASAAGLAALDGSRQTASAQAPPAAKSKWDLSWFDDFKGQHKQLYDMGSYSLVDEPAPLRYIAHYLEAHKEVSGLQPSEINTVVGTMYSAFPLNASDPIWEKFKLGERWKIIDPRTKAPAIRNIFLEDGPLSPGVKKLQSRGTVFWQCNVALGKVVMVLSQSSDLSPLEVRNELVAGLNPGVRLVPAHVFAVGLAQERGFTYMKP